VTALPRVGKTRLVVTLTTPIGDTRTPAELAEAIARELGHVTAEARYLDILELEVEVSS